MSVLITRFGDLGGEFRFVPADRVGEISKAIGAILFDVPGSESTHSREGEKEFVGFDAVIWKYAPGDPALLEMAKIVRGADAKIPDAPPESAAAGFRANAKDTMKT